MKPANIVKNCTDIFRITGGQFIFDPKNVRNTTKTDIDMNFQKIKISLDATK